MLPKMRRDEREKFLSEVRVGVLGVEDDRPSYAPLLAPVWYEYAPGGTVVVQTGRDSVKGRLIRSAQRFSLCVQDETPPYRYVSVEGPVVDFRDPADPLTRESMAVRYLGAQEAERYLRATADQLRDDVTFRMRPQHWRTANFTAFADQFA
jgi:hypothetical protein